MERIYSNSFATLPPGEADTAVNIYEAALYEVLMHEYFHHFLGHVDRIRNNELSRIDAEFEADRFAITNGMQSRDPVSAMYYVFWGLAQKESYQKKRPSELYESATCRWSNVENITGYLGIAPLMLADAAYGGGAYFRRSSPSLVRTEYLNGQFAKAAALKEGSCSQIVQVPLDDMRGELKRLYLRMEPDLDFLFSADKNVDTARAKRLLRDLADMSQNFQYINDICREMHRVHASPVGLKGRNLRPLTDELDRLLDTPAVTDNFLSEDFGRIMEERALAILQEQADMPLQARLDRSFSTLERAVFYNPAQTEAWMNLAFIALKRGNCTAASRYAKRAVETNTDGEQRKSSQFFLTAMEELSNSPEACRRQGAAFHPYKGL